MNLLAITMDVDWAPDFAIEYVAEDSAWLEERLDTGSIPTGALQRIVDWLQ